VSEISYQLTGELDLARASGVGRDLADFASGHRGSIAVDCAELTFIDSAGIDTLVRMQRTLCIQGRQLRLVNLRPIPRRVVEILGLEDFLAIDEVR
jgi:anti-sigma B factor antagonist